jgi:hypothetical protein
MLINHQRTIKDTEVVRFVAIDDRIYAQEEYRVLRIMIIAMTDIIDWNEFQRFKEDINLRILDILEEFKQEKMLPSYTDLKEAGILPEPRHPEPTNPANAIPSDAANEPERH